MQCQSPPLNNVQNCRTMLNLKIQPFNWAYKFHMLSNHPNVPSYQTAEQSHTCKSTLRIFHPTFHMTPKQSEWHNKIVNQKLFNFSALVKRFLPISHHIFIGFVSPPVFPYQHRRTCALHVPLSKYAIWWLSISRTSLLAYSAARPSLRL